MRVFLDECVDWRLARDIIGHDVKTARQMGWRAIENGELLTLASKQFDVFVTVDRNLSFQQNLASSRLPLLCFKRKATGLPTSNPWYRICWRPSNPRCPAPPNSLASSEGCARLLTIAAVAIDFRAADGKM